MTSNLETFYQDYNPSLHSFFEEATLTSEVPSNTDYAPLHENYLDIEERFVNKSPVARGGMKKISRAEDLKTGRFLAIAELREDLSPNSSKFEKFLREARITAALQHPNIMPVYDIDLTDGEKPYFTMPLMPGINLYTITKELRVRNPN